MALSCVSIKMSSIAASISTHSCCFSFTLLPHCPHVFGEAFLLLILHLPPSLHHLLFIILDHNCLGAAVSGVVSWPIWFSHSCSRTLTHNEWWLRRCDALWICIVLCCSHHDHPCNLHFRLAEPHLMMGSCKFIRSYLRKRTWSFRVDHVDSVLQSFCQRWGYYCALVSTYILCWLPCVNKHLLGCCITLHVLGSSCHSAAVGHWLISQCLLLLGIY